MALGPGNDRRFDAYVLKHNGTPIWVGLGSGSRQEVKSHCTRTATPDAKREYILGHLSEITSEIAGGNLTWSEAAKTESDLIEEFGLLCDGTGTLFNRTYGADYGEQVHMARLRKSRRRNAPRARGTAADRQDFCGVATATALQAMNPYCKAGGDAGYRLLLDPNYAPKRRLIPKPEAAKAGA